MFKDRLKLLRERKNLTQAELAKELQIGRASISNYELGTRIPSIGVLNKICEYFNVSTDYLTGNDDYNLERSIPNSYLYKIRLDQLNLQKMNCYPKTLMIMIHL